jgi:hypothetical protein
MSSPGNCQVERPVTALDIVLLKEKYLVFVVGLGPEMFGTFGPFLSFYIASNETPLHDGAPNGLHATALIPSPNKLQTKSDRVTGPLSLNMGSKLQLPAKLVNS